MKNDTDYLRLFSEEQRRHHTAIIASLTQKKPFLFVLDEENYTDSHKEYLLTTFQFDLPGIVSCETGIIASCGFHIQDGTVVLKSFEREKRGISFFSIHTDLTNYQRNIDALHKRLQNFAGHLSNAFRTRESIFIPVIQSISESLEAIENIEKSAQPILVDLEQTDTHHISVQVHAEDTNFFLFFVTYGLYILNISIEYIHIRTEGTQINDSFIVHDPQLSKIDFSERKKTISLVILLTKQLSQNLNAAPDIGKALARCMQIIQDAATRKATYFIQDLLTEQAKQKDLATLLGFSDFLWENFLRQQYETLRTILGQSHSPILLSAQSDELCDRLDDYIGEAETTKQRIDLINKFKDQENFLIDVDHILHKNLNFFFLSERLTTLADTIITYIANTQWQHCTNRWGFPKTGAGTIVEWHIFGLGKLGGRALGYASDLELLCLYSDTGHCDGDERITNHEFFEIFFKDVAKSIYAKKEGIFKVDLRLRPHGDSGPVAVSFARFISFFQPDSKAHSLYRLALTRLRPITGSNPFAQRVLSIRDSVLYEQDSIDREEIRTARNAQLSAFGDDSRPNAKFSPGALVDTEYNVQLLQVTHGKKYTQLRTSSIHTALREMATLGIIRVQDSEYMIEAYGFLRRLNNALRMLRGNATDLFIPDISSAEFKHLARRLYYNKLQRSSTTMQLYLDFQTHTARVRHFIETHLGEAALPNSTKLTVLDLLIREQDYSEMVKTKYFHMFKNPLTAYRNLRTLASRHIDSPRFSMLLLLIWGYLGQSIDPDLALNNLELFVSRIKNPEEFYSNLLEQPYRLEILTTILSISPFLSTVLATNTKYLDWLAEHERIHNTSTIEIMESELYTQLTSTKEKKQAQIISEFRRREILRISIRDILLNLPFASITREISNLATACMRTYMRVLTEQTIIEHSSSSEKFCILAFGKFGACELNYSSDIDILGIYVSSDERSNEDSLFSEYFRKIIQVLSKNTPSGRSYRIDLRLQPHGNIGSIVHTETSIMRYYEEKAEFWELQATLKLSPVAGNLEIGEKLVHAIRKIVAKRLISYQPATICTLIHRMLENIKTQVKNNDSMQEDFDVKRSEGGIRNIEFLVQALQLIHRGELIATTYTTLSALEKLHELSILSNKEYTNLSTWYVTLRKIEHILQLLEDRQTHTIPNDEQIQLKIGKVVFSQKIIHVDTFQKNIQEIRNGITTLCGEIFVRSGNIQSKETAAEPPATI